MHTTLEHCKIVQKCAILKNYPIWAKKIGRISAGGSVFIMHISHALITCELKNFLPFCCRFSKLLFPPLQSSHKRKVKFENESLLHQRCEDETKHWLARSSKIVHLFIIDQFNHKIEERENIILIRPFCLCFLTIPTLDIISYVQCPDLNRRKK